MASTKKSYIPERQAAPLNVGFYKEAMEKERKFILGQLRESSNAVGANPFVRIMHMNSSTLPTKTSSLDPLVGVKSLSSAEKVSYVNDNGGEFMLSRGTLPSSIPGRYDAKSTSMDWKSLQAKYNELTSELKSLDDEIERKQTEIASKLKNADPSVRSMTTSVSSTRLRHLHNPTTVSSAIRGYGFEWKGAHQSNSNLFGSGGPEAEELRKTLCNDQKTVGLWGDLTKGCDLPQRSLYLRSEPFVPKTKRGGLISPSSPIAGST